MNKLQKRIIDITYKKQISHLSSTLSSAPIIDEIYNRKHPDDPFILSNGHSALALYCVLEKYYGIDAEMLLDKHGIHPHRDPDNHIYVSTGSLGMGITVAVGYALADKTRNVWCLISDGESGEGSVWEALRFINDAKLTNLHVYANVNGQIAYDTIDPERLIARYRSFLPTIEVRQSQPPNYLGSARGVLTHYYVLKSEEYQSICENYSDNS